MIRNAKKKKERKNAKTRRTKYPRDAKEKTTDPKKEKCKRDAMKKTNANRQRPPGSHYPPDIQPPRPVNEWQLRDADV
jgi:hypothetical protein